MIEAWLMLTAGCVALHAVLQPADWLMDGLLSFLVAGGAWFVTRYWIKAWNLAYTCTLPIHLARLALGVLMALGGWLFCSYTFALSMIVNTEDLVLNWIRDLVPSRPWIWDMIDRVLLEKIQYVGQLHDYVVNSRLAVVGACVILFVLVMGIIANRAYAHLHVSSIT